MRGSRLRRPADLSARDLVILAIFAAGSIVSIGYRFGSGDHAVYIPLVRHILDPAYLRNDWWVTSWGGLHGGFVRGLALLSRAVGVEVASFLLHVVERMLFVAGIFILSRRIFHHRPAAFLAVLIVLFSYDWNLGGNPTVLPHSIPHTLALVPGIFALIACLDGRLEWTGLWLALATLVHVLIGLELALVLGVFLISRRSAPRKPLLRAAFIYAASSSPVIIPLLAGQLRESGAAGLTGRDYVRIVGHIRAPWHYLPSTWPLETYAVFFIFLGAALVAWGMVRRDAAPEGNRLVEAVTLTIFALCLIGVVFVEWIPIAVILKLQFFRLMVVLKLLLSLYVARYLAGAVDTGHPLHVALAALVMLGVGNPTLLASAFILFVLAGGSAALRANALPVGSGLGLMAAALVYLLSVRRPTWLTPSEGFSLVLIACGLAGIQAMARRWHPEHRQAIGAAIGVFLLVFATMHLPLNVVWSAVPRTLAANIEIHPRPRDPWQSLGRWAREHTAEEAVFITPPYLEGFRTWSDRAIVVDFKSFAFEDTGALEWFARIRDLMDGSVFEEGGDRIAEMRRGYAALGEREYGALRAKYHAEYVIVPSHTRLTFPLIHKGDGFAVYRLGDAP